jgi:hypothetical protein
MIPCYLQLQFYMITAEDASLRLHSPCHIGSVVSVVYSCVLENVFRLAMQWECFSSEQEIVEQSDMTGLY